jgi:hypothetical protein
MCHARELQAVVPAVGLAFRLRACDTAVVPLLAQGQLRTQQVMERLKAAVPAAGQRPPLLVYLGVLLQKGALNAGKSGWRCMPAARHFVAPIANYEQVHGTPAAATGIAGRAAAEVRP